MTTGSRTGARAPAAHDEWDDDVRIDACTELASLERWLDQAITAVGAAAVLG